jgi:hypothetical protein
MTTSLSHIHHHSEEVLQFKDTIHIHGKKIQVHQFNQSRLHDLNLSVLAISAIHKDINTAEASSDDVSDLHPVISLSIGTRIMLVENIGIERGLISSALITVCSII